MGMIRRTSTAANVSMEEAAANLWMTHMNTSPAVRYCRKQRTSAMTAKQAARERILSFYTAESWPDALSILTFPGMTWEFERQLLGERADAGAGGIFFTCIERDAAIYRASLGQMPGLTRNLAVVGCKPFATATLRNDVIGRYYQAEFENLAAYTGHLQPMHAAWLDFTGPLSITLVAAIKRFVDARVSHTITITSLGARWNTATSATVKAHGGLRHWIATTLDGFVLDDHTYNDNVPMHQVTLLRKDTRQ